MSHNLTKLYSMLETLLNRDSDYTLEMYDSKDDSDRYYFYQYRRYETRMNIRDVRAQIRELQYQKGLV